MFRLTFGIEWKNCLQNVKCLTNYLTNSFADSLNGREQRQWFDGVLGFWQ